MQKVFVLDTTGKQLDMCHPGQARRLLKAGLAAVYKRFPFTIILKKEVVDPQLQTYQLKLDPGSKTTGLALVNQETGEVVFAAEIEHRGETIKSSLDSRRGVRSNRRNRKTRYRKPRFNNRTRAKGWLAPSVLSRVANVETWVRRLIKLCPIKGISLELVKFDTQLMQSAEIKGVEYQQGSLAGYELREYLLEKYKRKCAYCGKENTALQIEHIVPKSRGGSNRVTNLTIACEKCNIKKGNKTATEFGYPQVQAQAKVPLKDAAAVNSTRWEILNRLKEFQLPIEIGSGGLTKFNRSSQKLAKAHWIDAACVGISTPLLKVDKITVLEIKATGHGSRQMCLMDKFGFPRTKAKAGKKFFGFATGDMVKAVVTKGKKAGTYTGKVAVRASGSFNISTSKTTIQGISHKYCKLIFSCDGYSYSYLTQYKTAIPPTSKAVGFLAGDL
ncbi:MAG: HNH endonuclease [Blastocatellia bacterium]|nr:HNH endonuclease [Blastocatellia bacterium]